MSSYILKDKKQKFFWKLNHQPHSTHYHTSPPPCDLAALVFFKYIYCMHCMILMSKKMMSQKKLGEIKSVP